MQIGRSDAERGAAQGRKGRNTPERRGARCVTGMGKTDTERSGTRMDFITMRTGAEVTQIKKRDRGKTSTREEKQRYSFSTATAVTVFLRLAAGKVAPCRLTVLQCWFLFL